MGKEKKTKGKECRKGCNWGDAIRRTGYGKGDRTAGEGGPREAMRL